MTLLTETALILGVATATILKTTTTAARPHPVQWWAQVVGALQVHPHEHCADYPEL